MGHEILLLIAGAVSTAFVGGIGWLIKMAFFRGEQRHERLETRDERLGSKQSTLAEDLREIRTRLQAVEVRQEGHEDMAVMLARLEERMNAMTTALENQPKNTAIIVAKAVQAVMQQMQAHYATRPAV